MSDHSVPKSDHRDGPTNPRRVHLRGASATGLAALVRAEAELISERQRLGREIHDVLAHTLGAVSIQLTALDSRVAAGDPPEDVSERIGAIHRLVGDGLLEARNAVRALRDEGLPLVRRLRRLCDFHGARFIVTGQALSLRREATHALYRVAQEALTNAAKHAPGGAVSVSLNFGPDGARIRIDNERSDVHGSSPLASAGGGYGLAGLRERVQLAGGRFHAGPSNAGWRVSADVGIQCGSHGRGG